MIYDYFLTKSERYANWFSANLHMDRDLAQQLFWIDVSNGTYFRICSNFLVRTPEHYYQAARQYMKSPDAYLTIINPYLRQYEQLKFENPELFI